jgi:hypothetical protein
VLGVKNADKLVPIEDDQTPIDPVQENQNILTGKPVKAFIEQDHQAHIAVHMAAMQDPKIMQIVGQNPMAQQIQASMMAHINEHVAFEYRKQIEEQLGLPMPSEDQNKAMDPEVAAQVAQLAAKASARLLQRDQAEAQQQQAQQQMQDPILQMQMQELQLKMKKMELEEKKLATDAAAKADQLLIEKQRLQTQERIAAMQVGAKAASDRANLKSRDQIEGLKMGAQIAKERAQMSQPRQQPRK